MPLHNHTQLMYIIYGHFMYIIFNANGYYCSLCNVLLIVVIIKVNNRLVVLVEYFQIIFLGIYGLSQKLA